jgi:hypothetical protein
VGIENRAPWKMFGPKWHDIVEGLRKMHSKELHNLYCSPNIIKMIKSSRMRWAGPVERMGAKRNAYRILMVKPDGRGPIGRPKHWWEHNKMTLGS